MSLSAVYFRYSHDSFIIMIIVKFRMNAGTVIEAVPILIFSSDPDLDNYDFSNRYCHSY